MTASAAVHARPADSRQPAGPLAGNFQELVGGFLSHLRFERRLAKNTLVAYGSDLARFGEFLERRGLGALSATREDVVTFFDELASAEISSATRQRRTASLRGFYRFLTIEELLDADPTTGLRAPRPSRRLPRVLRPAEVTRLLEAPAGESPQALRDRALLELLYASGLRISEAASLGMADVDLTGLSLRVSLGKGDKDRVVPFGRGAQVAVRVYLRRGRPRLTHDPSERHLFVGRHGRALTRQRLYQIVQQHAHAAGIAGLNPHVLRHTCATHLLKGGCDLRILQEILGHADLTSTQQYTHLSIDDLKDAHYRAHPRASLARQVQP